MQWLVDSRPSDLERMRVALDHRNMRRLTALL
jgi:hypothetical protein